MDILFHRKEARVERRSVSAPTASVVLLVLVVGAQLALGLSEAHVIDCMSNPFASGCRGISAKRSAMALGERALEWSPEVQRLEARRRLAGARQQLQLADAVQLLNALLANQNGRPAK